MEKLFIDSRSSSQCFNLNVSFPMPAVLEAEFAILGVFYYSLDKLFGVVIRRSGLPKLIYFDCAFADSRFRFCMFCLKYLLFLNDSSNVSTSTFFKLKVRFALSF